MHPIPTTKKKASPRNAASSQGESIGWTISARQRWGFGIFLALLFIWSYAGTLRYLIQQWETVPDYSHGFLVLPLAIFFLWMGSEKIPTFSKGLYWPGLALIGLAGLARVIAARYFLVSIDGWSIPIWISGVVMLLGGWRMFVWALPAIAFLLFMVPLPYTVENMLALPLQAASTAISCFLLQCFQLPAIQNGNTIVIGEHILEVARACSGMRIFVGVAAICYAFAILFRRPYWLKFLLVISILPIALAANSARIVATGLMFQFGFGESAKQFSHDFAGWVMTPFAALLFGLFLVYLDRLFVKYKPVDGAGLTKASI